MKSLIHTSTHTQLFLSFPQLTGTTICSGVPAKTLGVPLKLLFLASPVSALLTLLPKPQSTRPSPSSLRRRFYYEATEVYISGLLPAEAPSKTPRLTVHLPFCILPQGGPQNCISFRPQRKWTRPCSGSVFNSPYLCPSASQPHSVLSKTSTRSGPPFSSNPELQLP